MKNFLSFYNIVILVLFLCCFLLILNNFTTVEHKELSESNNSLDSLSTIYYQKKIHDQYYSECFQLNPDLIVSTINLDSLTIGSIIQKSTKLVLRFNEYTCDVCVRDEISALEGIAKVIGKENIIVISSFSRIRDFISFKKLNQIPYSCYNLCKSNLGLDIEKLNHPFLFVLDDDFITKLVFIPETNISFVQTDYFNIIINRFFRNN